MTDTNTEQDSRTDQVKGAAGEVASDAGQKAGAVIEHAKDEAAQVATVAGQRVSDVLGSAGNELRDRARAEAGNVGQSLDAVATELRAMSQASSESGGMTAGLVTGLADQVEQGAQRLSAGDLDLVLDDVKRFARNRPGTFLLGAAGAGFLVGRLLRAADLGALGQAAKPSSSTGDEQERAVGREPVTSSAQPSGTAALPAPEASDPEAAG